MSVRYGRCRNPLACSLADTGTVLRLAEGETFVCPECARPLVPAAAWGARKQRRWALLALATLTVAGAGGAAVLLLLPSATPVAHIAQAPGATQPATFALASISASRPPGPAGTQTTAPIETTRRPAPIPAPLALPAVTAPTWPAPVNPQPNPKPKPPKPRMPTPSVEPASQDTPAPQTPEPQPDYEQVPAPVPTPAPPQATAPVAAAAPPTSPPVNPRVIVLPAGSSLSFGPLQGVNLPSLPARMMFVDPEQARKPGSIQVDCKIGLDGVPSDCRKVAEKGAADVSDTILAWLASGAIRYTPGQKDGHRVVERRILTVNFGGPPKGP